MVIWFGHFGSLLAGFSAGVLGFSLHSTLQPRDIKHEIENVKERWKFYRVYCLNRLIDFANYFFIELLAFGINF